MSPKEQEPPAPFQFGIRSLLVLTTGVAIVCGVCSWTHWWRGLFSVILLFACCLAYLLSFVCVWPRIAHGSRTGSNRVVTVALAILLLVFVLVLFDTIRGVLPGF